MVTQTRVGVVEVMRSVPTLDMISGRASELSWQNRWGGETEKTQGQLQGFQPDRLEGWFFQQLR